ncbi:MAG: hypothetical protein IT371_22520 [Deltaproteobacteria bacterium]|nr:hypothetical protein [Deltaproteobacteria bacterium]
MNETHEAPAADAPDRGGEAVRSSARRGRALLAVGVLGLLGVGLLATAIPGVFTVDEDNYLATVVSLRHGRLTVPGTEGLPPSKELIWFEPTPPRGELERTPVTSGAPPLYALLAWPASFFGWRGLVALNVLAFLGLLWVVHRYAARHATRAVAAWVAVAACGLGGYLVEYAQGVWPHLISIFLNTAAFALASRAREGGRLPVRALLGAGLLAGLAVGVRYPNLLYAVGTGLGLLLLAERRVAASALFAAGMTGPVLLSTLLNGLRLGVYNPVTRGKEYYRAGDAVYRSRALELVVGFAARFLDYGLLPAATGDHARWHPYLSRSQEGIYYVGRAIKKAWVQSVPWVLVPVLYAVRSWLPGPAGASAQGATTQRAELRAIALVCAVVMASLASFGLRRDDGLCYNQRYYLDLLPVAAVALGWALEGGLAAGARPLGLGALLGAGLALPVLLLPTGEGPRFLLLAKVPLLLGGVALLGWVLASGRRPRALVLVGLALGWAAAVHLGDDLPASRLHRAWHRKQLEAIRPHIPDRSALFACWGRKDALGPLLLERDLVIADLKYDDGKTAPALANALLSQGRRVFLLGDGCAREWVLELLTGRPIRRVKASVFLLELSR